jgi:RNA polymerase sigma-70 factor, ECF subfamily
MTRAPASAELPTLYSATLRPSGVSPVTELSSPTAEELLRLFNGQHRRIYMVALRIVRDPAVADEVVQETFLNAWMGWTAFRGESSRETWVYGIGIRCALKALRTEMRIHTISDSEAVIEKLADSQRGPVETSIDLERAITRLPPRARTVFVLRDVEGFAVDEVAALLGMAAGTVKAHLFNARKRLAADLDPT